MKLRKFYNDTYGFTVHLIHPVTPVQFTRYVQRVYDPAYKNPGEFTALCHSDADTVIIGFERWRGGASDLGVLTHEVFHAAHRMLEYRGINLSDGTSEVFAYLLESLFNKSLELLKMSVKLKTKTTRKHKKQ